MKEEITELLIEQGDEPEEAKSEALEQVAELLSGSPLEEKVGEILDKVTTLESSITKITKLFEKGGIFSGLK